MCLGLQLQRIYRAQAQIFQRRLNEERRLTKIASTQLRSRYLHNEELQGLAVLANVLRQCEKGIREARVLSKETICPLHGLAEAK